MERVVVGVVVVRVVVSVVEVGVGLGPVLVGICVMIMVSVVAMVIVLVDGVLEVKMVVEGTKSGETGNCTVDVDLGVNVVVVAEVVEAYEPEKNIVFI